MWGWSLVDWVLLNMWEKVVAANQFLSNVLKVGWKKLMSTLIDISSNGPGGIRTRDISFSTQIHYSNCVMHHKEDSKRYDNEHCVKSRWI